jgi:hypothetical protein
VIIAGVDQTVNRRATQQAIQLLISRYQFP